MPDKPDAAARGGLPRVLTLLLGLAAAWVALQGINGLKDYIAPVFFALNLMIVVYPVKTMLQRVKVPAAIGSVICGLLVFAVLVAFFWALGWAVMALAQELPKYGTQFTEIYQQVLSSLSQFGIGQSQLNQAFQQFNPSSLLGYVSSLAGSLSGALALLVVIITTIVFLMMDAIGFTKRLDVARELKPNFVGSLINFAGGVRRYWVVTTVFGLIVAILDLVLLLILGIPLPMVWAVLSLITNYIPNIGFIIGLVPPGLMALLDRGPVMAIVVVAGYCVINVVIQTFIQPKFTGDAVGVTPTVSFLSVVFWTWALGPLGALLALPATLFFKAIFIDADPASRWINAFLASKPEVDARPIFADDDSDTSSYDSRAETSPQADVTGADGPADDDGGAPGTEDQAGADGPRPDGHSPAEHRPAGEGAAAARAGEGAPGGTPGTT